MERGAGQLSEGGGNPVHGGHHEPVSYLPEADGLAKIHLARKCLAKILHPRLLQSTGWLATGSAIGLPALAGVLIASASGFLFLI